MDDLEAFTRAAGFDEVEVSDRSIHIANRVGIATIELELAVVDDAETTLTIEQRDGLIAEMQTTYDLQAVADGTEVTATTEFALDVAIVGGVLDATVIKRQRRNELTAQLEYLESTAGVQSRTE